MSGVGSNDVLISVWYRYMLQAWSKQAILFTTKEEGEIKGMSSFPSLSSPGTIKLTI